MKDGSRLNSVFKHTVKTNATLLASNWSNEAPYTQTITLDDNIDTELNVDVNIAYSGVKETDNVLNKAAGCLTYIKKNVNNIVFYCLKKKPEIDIPIEIEGSCRNSIGSVNVIDGLKPNFEIVKYETEEELLADTPAENTIGIITDTEIVSWIFSATEPESPMEGMVWFVTDRASSASFNALKKNGIQVYPVFAKQYVGGAWVDKTAKTWLDGAWVDWVPQGALYWDGIQVVEWIPKNAVTQSGWTAIQPVYNNDTVTLNSKAYANQFCGIVTKDKIDVTGYSKLVVEVEGTASAADSRTIQLYISSKQSNFVNEVAPAYKKIEAGFTGSVELPFTASGSYYIDIFTIRTASLTIKRVYLKK